MNRPRLSRAIASALAILAIAVCLLSSVQRAHGGGGKTKKAWSADSAPTPAEPAPAKAATVKAASPKTATAKVPSAKTAATPPPDPASAQAPDPASARAPDPSIMATNQGNRGTSATSPPSPLALASGAEAGAKSESRSVDETDLTSLPVSGGLPVMVDIGVYVLDIRSFDDVKGEFEATTDLRLRWKDPRLRFPVQGVNGQYLEYRGKEAEQRLAKLWTPNIDIDNRQETIGYVGHRLRVFSDGQVETLVRSTGRFRIDVDVQNFPFDVQALRQSIVVRDQTTDEVMLHFDKDDEEFSRASDNARIESWTVGDVDLDAGLLSGWNGDRYSRVTASLMLKRSSSSGLTTIFIPLLASLLIPLLTLWMNQTTREGFQVEAFELANMGIGGLFSVIALSFAVSSSYGNIAGSDNTVTRLFALNYTTLAISLGVVVVLYRCNLVLRLFGPYVHEQVFRFVLWALPVLTLSTSLAFVLVAAC